MIRPFPVYEPTSNADNHGAEEDPNRPVEVGRCYGNKRREEQEQRNEAGLEDRVRVGDAVEHDNDERECRDEAGDNRCA